MATFTVQVDCPEIPEISIVEFIGQVIGSITDQIGPLDKEINWASQGDAGQVKALSESVSAIKANAEQTTRILNEILGNKDKLEVAIARLEGPGQTLLQLTKLVELVKTLEAELKGDPQEDFGYFSSVAELLSDVKKHVAKFEAYASTPQLKSVQTKVRCIQDELERMVQWRVREIGPLLTTDEDGVGAGAGAGAGADSPPPAPASGSSRKAGGAPDAPSTRQGQGQGQGQGSKQQQQQSSAAAAANLEILSQVADVVAVLGAAFRKDLLVRFAQLQLLPYDKLFSLGSRYSGVDSLDRRYAWFRRLLKLADAKVGSIFPTAWLLPVFLLVEFIRRTRNQLSEVLGAAPQVTYKTGSQEETMQIARLLAAIRSVQAFEKEILAQFNAAFGRHVASAGGSESGGVESLVKESMSEAFDPFMFPWISAERVRLDELLERLNKEETEGKAPAPLPGSGIEYNSSREMFAYIKASLGRCTEFSRGQTYVAMSREYRLCLGKYAEKLRFRLPIPEVPKPGKPPVYVISNAVEYRLCRIVTTCVFCVNTVPKLEEIMKEAVKPDFQAGVHFSDEIDAFEDLIDSTLTIINAGIVGRMEEAFKEMKKVDWTRVESIGDDSKYCKAMRDALSEAMPRMRKGIPAERFLLACRKLAEAMLDAIKESIYKLKRIAKIGAEQLKMDLHGMKEFLLRLPTVRLAADAEPVVINKAYSAAINARFTSIQNILKLVSAEDENVSEIFSLLWPKGTQAELDAIFALRCKQGGLMPSLPSAGVGKAAKDLTSGMKSAFSEMLFGSDNSDSHNSKGKAAAGGGAGQKTAQAQASGAKAKPAPAPATKPAAASASASAAAAGAAAAARPASAGAASSAPQVSAAAATQRILAFYEKQDPGKLEHVRGLLAAKYKGKEAELLAKVQAQYPTKTV